MPHLRIEARLLDAVVESSEPEGGRLLDICDDQGAPVPFSCRGASCGICRIDILEGEFYVEPADEDERYLLDLFGDPPTRRLACRVRIRPGDGSICLRVVEDG